MHCAWLYYYDHYYYDCYTYLARPMHLILEENRLQAVGLIV